MEGNTHTKKNGSRPEKIDPVQKEVDQIEIFHDLMKNTVLKDFFFPSLFFHSSMRSRRSLSFLCVGRNVPPAFIYIKINGNSFNV